MYVICAKVSIVNTYMKCINLFCLKQLCFNNIIELTTLNICKRQCTIIHYNARWTKSFQTFFGTRALGRSRNFVLNANTNYPPKNIRTRKEFVRRHAEQNLVDPSMKWRDETKINYSLTMLSYVFVDQKVKNSIRNIPNGKPWLEKTSGFGKVFSISRYLFCDKVVLFQCMQVSHAFSHLLFGTLQTHTLKT